jgi:hypothetical protein
MNRPYRRISLFVLSVLFVGVALPVAAQNVLEEIVVTAQKREQNIQDVGIANYRIHRRSDASAGCHEQF